MNLKTLSAAIVLCLACSQAQAYDFVSGGIVYNVISNTSTRKTAAVTYATTNPDASGYVTTYKGDVVIPAQTSWQLQTFNVTQVGDLAMFNNQSLYTLSLPEGITAIGSQAFSHCYSLYKINIPSTVNRIADFAFEFCEDLKEIAFPARLTTFGDGVFQQCFGLENISIDAECVEFKSIDGVMFSTPGGREEMTLLVYPGSHPGADYVMPDGVTTVNTYAFSANRSLKNLTLSKDLTEIEPYSFSECEALEGLFVAEGSTAYSSDNGVLLNADGTTLLIYPLMRPDAAYEIPEGVTSIDALAFNSVKNLTDLTLPSSLSHIGEFAFYQNRSLRKITSNAVVPPTYSVSSMYPTIGLFDDTVFAQATLFVPEEALEAYRTAPGWKKFANIRAIGSSGIENIGCEEPVVETEYFGIDGRRSAGNASGLVIVRRGSKVIKQLRR